MKKMLLIASLSILLCGCQKSVGISKIDCDKKDELVKSGAILIDVRTKEEYDEYHLKGAINIPYDEINDFIKDYAINTDDVIVYCQSGKRSNVAANTLKALGYENIYDLGSIENCEK